MRDRELRKWRALVRDRADREWRQLSLDVVDELATHLADLHAAALRRGATGQGAHHGHAHHDHSHHDHGHHDYAHSHAAIAGLQAGPQAREGLSQRVRDQPAEGATTVELKP